MNLWPCDAFGGMWLACSTAAGIPNRNHITASTEPQLVHQNLQIFGLKPKSGPPECLCLKINMCNNPPKHKFWDSTNWIYPPKGFSSEVFPRLSLICVGLRGGGGGGGISHFPPRAADDAACEFVCAAPVLCNNIPPVYAFQVTCLQCRCPPCPSPSSSPWLRCCALSSQT